MAVILNRKYILIINDANTSEDVDTYTMNKKQYVFTGWYQHSCLVIK